MTRRIGDTVIIEAERPQQCDQCGAIAELRPYGPGYSMICYECGIKDRAGTERRMKRVLFEGEVADE